MGAMYAFIGVRTDKLPHFNDQKFALELLERKHVLVAPGTSFNVPYHNYFRVTLLPDWETMREVFARINELLMEQYNESPGTRLEADSGAHPTTDAVETHSHAGHEQSGPTEAQQTEQQTEQQGEKQED